MDSENQKFCPIHSKYMINTDSKAFCLQCHQSKLFDERIVQRDGKNWSVGMVKYAQYNPDCKRIFCMCHNCKYFMFHPLNYCFKCPNKISRENITYKELYEKYKDYKEGW